jgi:hypothetical protein
VTTTTTKRAHAHTNVSSPMVQQTNFFLPCFLISCGSTVLVIVAFGSYFSAQGPIGESLAPPPVPGPSSPAPVPPPPLMAGSGGGSASRIWCPPAYCQLKPRPVTACYEAIAPNTTCHFESNPNLCVMGVCQGRACRRKDDPDHNHHQPLIPFACHCECR